MSINLTGDSFVDTDAFATIPVLGFGVSTHSVVASSFIDTDVDVSVASLGLTEIPVSVNNQTSVFTTASALSLAGANHTIVGTPEPTNTDVFASTANLSWTANNTTTDAIIDPSAPSWLINATIGRWGVVPTTNTAADVYTGSGQRFPVIRELTEFWSGATVEQDRKEFIIPMAGGHADGSSNEVILIDLMQESPSWTQVRSPGSTSGGTEGDNSIANYGDGQPRAAHTYHRPAAGNGSVWMLGVDAMAGGVGFSSAASYQYDLTQPVSGDWNYLGNPVTNAEGGGSRWLGGSGAYDPVTNSVFATGQFGGANRLVRIDCDTLIFTVLTAPPQPQYNWMCVCEDLRLLVVGGHPPDGGSQSYLHIDNDISGSTATWSDINYTGTHRWGLGRQGNYHAGSRAIYSWDGDGATLYKLSIPTTLTNNWTWSTQSPVAGGVIPTSAEGNGTYGRFNMVKDMGNGQACFFLLNRGDENLFFYPMAASSEADWAARSAAATLWSTRFETLSEVTGDLTKVNSDPDFYLNYQYTENGVLGTVANPASNLIHRTSGGIANGPYMEHVFPASQSGANPGAWRRLFVDNQNQWPLNTPLHVSFCFRPDNRMINVVSGDAGQDWKISLLAGYGKSGWGNTCNDRELTNARYFGSNHIRHYTNCSPSLETTGFPTGGDFQRQNAVDRGSGSNEDRYCIWPFNTSGNSLGCYEYTADVWHQMYYVITNLPGGNADIQIYINYEGGTEWIPLEDYTNYSLWGTDEFNTLSFTLYSTSRGGTANSTFNCDYTEVLISEDPIEPRRVW